MHHRNLFDTISSCKSLVYWAVYAIAEDSEDPFVIYTTDKLHLQSARDARAGQSSFIASADSEHER